MLQPMERPPAIRAPLFAASMMPGPAPVMIAKPASASSRAVSCAASYCGSLGSVRAEPKMVTPLVTAARLSNPSMNSPIMRITRQGSVRVKSAASLGAWRSFSSSVTGLRKLRIESSITRVAPEARAAVRSDGGVRPAARCPSSVRSRRYSCASRAASAMSCGSDRFPLAVRGERGASRGCRRRSSRPEFPLATFSSTSRVASVGFVSSRGRAFEPRAPLLLFLERIQLSVCHGERSEGPPGVANHDGQVYRAQGPLRQQTARTKMHFGSRLA